MATTWRVAMTMALTLLMVAKRAIREAALAEEAATTIDFSKYRKLAMVVLRTCPEPHPPTFRSGAVPGVPPLSTGHGGEPGLIKRSRDGHDPFPS